MARTYAQRDAIAAASPEEKQALACLALGRIFRLGSRPYQEGDIALYEEARAVILDCAEPQPDHRPNWARDRRNGAAGD